SNAKGGPPPCPGAVAGSRLYAAAGCGTIFPFRSPQKLSLLLTLHCQKLLPAVWACPDLGSGHCGKTLLTTVGTNLPLHRASHPPPPKEKGPSADTSFQRLVLASPR